MNNFYSIFREYSLAIQDWLRNLVDLPYMKSADFGILRITLKGTTVVKNGSTSQTSGVDQHEIVLDTANHGIKAGEAIRIYNTLDYITGEGELEIKQNNDDWYMVQAVKSNIIILDKEYKLLTIEQPILGGRLKKCINVIYAEMQTAISRIAQPLRNGLVTTPGVAFYLSDQQMKDGMRPIENVYTRRYYDEFCNKTGTASVPPLQEWQISYNINIWSPYRAYMQMLQYQLVTEFTPQKFFWIPGYGRNDSKYGMDFTKTGMNDRSRREHHGQFSMCKLDSFSDVSELEGANTQQVFRSEMIITFDNAFVPLPFTTGNSINSIKGEYFINNVKTDEDLKTNEKGNV